MLIVLGAMLSVAAVVAWSAGVLPTRASRPPQNSILVIVPYRYNGTWVFDDARFGLVREPFVAGVPEMIDVLVADIPDADKGFRMTFASEAFPDFDKKLTWVREEGSGNYYKMDDPPMEGWLCPALFKYYETAPPEIFVKADPLSAK